MRVGMAFLKALGYMVVLLVIHSTLKNWGYRESLNVFFEELMGSTHTQARVKRMASISTSDYVLQVVINISDVERLQTMLGQLSYPSLINSTPEVQITGINTTTDPVDIDLVLDLRIPVSSVPSNFTHLFRNFPLPYNISQSLTIIDLNFTTWCSPNSTGGLQCECEEQFAWSCDKCDIYGACTNVTSPTCSCINGLPSDGGFCEPITSFLCNDTTFGVGNRSDTAKIPCEEEEGQEDKEGDIIAECLQNGSWGNKQKNCILRQVQELLEQSQFLNSNLLPVFLDQLSNVTVNFTEEVVASPLDISAIVDILNNVANASLTIPINKDLMKDVLLTVGILTSNESRESWNSLNANDTRNISEKSSPTARSVSSTLLQSVENITKALTNDSFNIDTPFILLNKTTFTNTFNADIEILDSAVETDIPESDGENKSITVITFASMENVLPARDENNSTSNFINGRVVLVYSDGTVNNVSFTFDILNDTLKKPQCVFWNFSLFDGLGGWDDEGCELVDDNNTVTCNCNHLTSFSMLMSPFSPNDLVLEFITYIGVGISMASLVICLIIEAVIWRKIRKNNTSYLRHVSIVNIAVSLLIANIWFIIGAAISEAEKKDRSACSAATFFIHLFYLALFFWMFASALLLLYRTVSVFEGLSKNSMLAIGFSLGYGAPLIIAIITIAVTAPNKEYIRETSTQLSCWLNFNDSKALLAFVIPALLIVAINLIILCVVIYKMLRRRAVGDAAQAAERNVLVVIIRSLAVLTPFFGLTWGLGVGTMTNPHNKGIHGSFAFFNSLQGFFILVFGTLLDKKELPG
ncbi:adhesion G-protein coupled receptor F1-like [Epinephelus moara]|uniref:adhesion G-protein coupled receptor F1-like n=1 Tax=Epinephelus moara TaxID=300413 RepID=UPI00214EEA40|nr:adhesion G-protein coupled receptor F1-like [Epinephelus moara]